MKNFLKKFHFSPPRGDKTNKHTTADTTIEDSLARATTLLSGITKGSESEFLAIGSSLLDFSQRAQDMSGIATSAVEIMSGQNIKGTIEGLRIILDQLAAHLGSVEKESCETSNTMDFYLTILKKVGFSTDELRMLVMNLRMLGFYTKVEHAQIASTDSGFTSLADDVKSLSESIDIKTSQISKESIILSPVIQKVLIEVEKIASGSGKYARAVVKKISSEHEMLFKRYEDATLTARRIAQTTENISENINTIVSSLQFNDITRQQIEHVTEALGNISAEGEHLSQRTISGLYAKVCDLQIAQLIQAKDELVRAINQVKDDLASIATNVKHISNDTKSLFISTEGSVFVDQIDQGIDEVIRFLDETGSDRETLAGTLGEVCTMVEMMSEFVLDIEKMGLSLQLIALNARIKAAHMGAEGAALDTISGSIYELSSSSREDTRKLSSMLREMTSSAEGFGESLALARSKETEERLEIVNSMKNLLETLHNMNEHITSSIRRLNEHGSSLAEDIIHTIESINVHEETSRIITDAIQEIEKASRVAKTNCPEWNSAEYDTLLESLSGRYTMESERDIHLEYSGLEEKGKDTDEEIDLWDNKQEPEDEDDLGDNVDLF